MAVLAPAQLHQQACLAFMQQLIMKITGLIKKTAFGYKYDKYLVNSTLQAFVNNAAIPVTPSSFLTDFSDVQDVNQTKEKYIRKSDGLLYEVKPDGSHELVELNSTAIQNLTEANKCLGTGFENDNTWRGPNTCAQYLDECIRGGDIAQCKNYLQNINFWNNAAKEVDAMQPLIAFKTLQSFEFGRVNTQLPNGQTIERVQTWSEWIDTLKNKVNPQELTQISGNVKLQEYLNLIVKKVNEIDLQIQSSTLPNQGVFFEGQVFDAYMLASRIIRSAEKQIILIDNYIDESTLTHLSKKNHSVQVVLLSKSLTKTISLDLLKANQQFGKFEWIRFERSHDRFLIIDGKKIYHLGASLKDLGKKWFAFSELNSKTMCEILDSINQVIKNSNKEK